jgi:exonuclease SbcC
VKLHSIRTVNLNSLYGEQTVDLDGALRGTSLFLIFGPTGSGKSTLMDAVSLALFGQTPRLNRDQRLGDEARPHAIMSRGTSMCLAEVVFSKKEPSGRGVYRARWSCQRARKKVDGKPKPPQRSLEYQRPDGTWKGLMSDHRKKVFGPKFDEVLEGFGVADFNRSMLLAQGEFDAFLGAQAKDRAKILERLTDTSIYRELGQRAARIHGRHKSRLKELGALASTPGGLAPEALSEVQASHDANTLDRDAAKSARDCAKADVDWMEAEAGLSEKLRAVRDEGRVLDDEVLRAKPQLDRLAEHERCAGESAFAGLDRTLRAEESLKKLDGQISALDASLPLLKENATGALEQADTARTRAQTAEGQLAALRPVVAAADKASGDLRVAQQRADEAEDEAKKAANLVTEATDLLGVATGAVVAAQHALKAGESDAEEHVADGALAEVWEGLRTRLDTLIATSDAVATAEGTLQTRRVALQRQQAALVLAKQRHEVDRNAALEGHVRRRDRARDALRGLIGEDVFDDVRVARVANVAAAHHRRDLLQAALAPVGNARAAASQLAVVNAKITPLGKQEARVAADLEKKRDDATRCSQLSDQAAESLRRTTQVAALVVQRASLVQGEPCQLCGADEHPWAHNAERAAADALISQTLLAAERDAAAAVEARDLATKACRTVDSELGVLGVKMQVLEAQRQQAAEGLERVQGACVQALEAAGLALDCALEEVDEALEQARLGATEAESSLQALVGAQSDLVGAGDAHREAVEGQKAEDTRLREQGVTLEERQQGLAVAVAEHTEARAARDLEQRACRQALDTAGLQLETNDPQAWRGLGDRRIREHADRLERVRSLTAIVREKQTACRGAKTAHDDRVGASEALRGKRDKRVGERDASAGDARREREAFGAVWLGILTSDSARPTANLPAPDAAPSAFLAAQETWVMRVGGLADRSAEAGQTATRRLSAAQTARATHQEGRGELERACADARTALNAALAVLALPGDDALRALRLADDQLVALRALQDKLDVQVVKNKTLRGERERAVNDHQTSRPKGLPEHPEPKALAAALASAEVALSKAGSAFQDTRDKLLLHEDAVKVRADAIRTLKLAETEARVWETLHGYIGKGDGDQFQQFAQALNLGQLLHKANVHLARLRKRYRLISRVENGLPTLDFDLEDRDQAGATVSPRSLSGGERFLVSLALALGLSDFRSVKMPIETLLLDEGFGTLDPDTLEVALAALSQLQTESRQVGIISHVVGLRERPIPCIEVRPIGGGRSEVKPH